MKRWIEDTIFCEVVIAAMAASGMVAYVISKRLIEAIRSL